MNSKTTLKEKNANNYLTHTKNSKGITLIALVITIIVLLILAGVAISMLSGENGILKQAAKAKTETEEKQAEENMKLLQLEAATNINGTEFKGTYYGESVTVPIPAGFTVSNKENERDVEKGLVVIDSDGNEFVWVPVLSIDSMAKKGTGTNKYQGKLYEESTFSKAGATEKSSYGQGNTSYREPDYLSSPDYGDAVTGDRTKGIGLLKSIVGLKGTDEEILNQWKTNLQNEFDDMIDSVSTNKGFYVGRYETSLTEDKTKAQSKKGEQAATAASDSANTWYELYQKQKEFAKGNGKIGSSMIWGCQYDQMMIWMAKAGISVTGNIGDKRNLGKDNAKTAVGTTGTTPTDVINNVYDLYGNGIEWTLEAKSTYIRVYRGGCCNDSSAPSSRYNYCPNRTNSNISSRLILYVK